MIDKREMQNYARRLGFTLGQAERDYLQHLFLLYLSKHSYNDIVFKGGTALQKAFGLNRYSVDLDFTQLSEIDLLPLMERIRKSITDFGYVTAMQESRSLGKTFIFKIHGPLYTDSSISLCSLWIEISQREKPLLKPEVAAINPVYKDLQPYTLMVMPMQEMLAEKIRAIDVYFILSKGEIFSIEFVNKKLAFYKESFDKQHFIEKLKEKKGLWEKELRKYVKDIPDFERVLESIIEMINT